MGTSETLRSVIDAGRAAKRLDELSTARVICKIAEQLHSAQSKAGAGKAIGPITPAGITIETTGAAKLGLAEPTAVTYSSPEQLTDDTSDRRSDVFSLGAVMWEALTHEPLFADAGEVKTKPIESPSELNANIPAELGAICMKALARNPSERYQSAKVMAAEIEAVLEEAGYADTDEQIAAYMAELGKKPAAPPKVTLITPPMGVEPTKPKLGDTLPSAGVPLPPVLPADPKVEAKVEPKVEPKKPEAAKPIEKKPEPEPAKAPDVPRAPVLPVAAAAATTVAEAPKPKAELPKPAASSTVLGFAPLSAATEPPKPADPVLLATPKTSLPEPFRPKPASTSPAPEPAPAPAPAASAAPIATIAKEGSKPNPAGVVALNPRRDSTGTVEVLGGWGWGTDAHEALAGESEYDDAPAASSKKTLIYVIGGGLGLAAIVTVIAIGFGGGSSSASKKPAAQPAAVVQEGSAPSPGSDTAAAPSPAPGSDTAAGSDVVAAAAPSGSAIAEVAPAPDAAEVAPAPDAAAVVAVAPPPTPTPAPPTPTPAPPPVHHVEAPPPPVHHAEPRPHHAEPAHVAHVDHSPPAPKVDVEAQYKLGLQLYMRGDTQGALAALRSALATNPSYAPTWRGLGLVFEKMNEKDQARAAYRKYLQLAPNAGDADHIRNRLERL